MTDRHPPRADVTTLDPLRLPLWGSRLIEASAGTGKTWTIAALYLRLVLGHGDHDTAFALPLQPAQILVMTFTTAATRELSDRIRARLVEAAACFRGQAVAGDPFLQRLSDDYPAGPAREAAAWRLGVAAQAMDDASVHTIDAWCQRMLREHAFDSGSLFDEELQPDESRMRAEAARDYWRQHVYPLPADILAEVLKVWRHVDDLTQDVRELLPLVEPDESADDEPDVLEIVAWRAEQECTRRLRELKSVWIERIARMQSWIESHRGVKHGSKFNVDRSLKWLKALGDWTTQESLLDPGLSDTAWLRLTPADLRDQMKSLPSSTIIPEEFDLFSALQQDIAALPKAGDAMRLHAARCVAQRMRQSKLTAGTYSFADMLERLDAALAGNRGARLRARIVEQYPVAMVDEFQDTSPLQYRLFDRLYDTRANDRATALFLIGDPKQSIYGFRGADIRSYLSARRATEGRHAALGTNFRSTHEVVDAVNQLFLQAEARPGPGAFRFREPADGGSALPFVAVAAQGRRDRLVSADGAVAAMTLCHDPLLRSKQDAQKQFARHCAQRIVALLNDPQAGFVEPGQPFRRLQPADIAVLVRTGAEAEAVRRALRLREVASVYLSDKDSVFATPEAGDLLLWLKAVAEPLDSRQARVAFATGTLGLSLAELASWSVDDSAFERRVDQLRHLHAVWQRQGVLAMLRQTLHLLDLPARWLARDDERRLTNVLHLAELLQHQAAGLDGLQALIRWFAQQIGSDDAGADEHIVRLESDADLVQIVTVHKSKGLEYPLVFAPFVCAFRAAAKGRRNLLSVAAPGGARRIVFAPTAADIATLDEERLQEDVRLLYVALTRARHALWLGVSAVKDRRPPCLFGRSAFGWLMSGADEVAEDRILPLLEAFAATSLGVVVERAPDDFALTRLDRQATVVPLQDAWRHAGRFEKHWSIGSFSSLVRDLGAMPGVGAGVDAALQEELLTAPVELPAVGADAPWHRFPRGALPGNFLHDQLEWLGDHRFSLDAEPDLRDRLRRRCQHHGYGLQADDVVSWLDAVTTTPLPPLGVTLAALPRTSREMEFWFPSDGIAASRLDAMCRRDLLNGRPRPPLLERQLHGMLMGFADLIFEHDGRYWVLDYKSNALGIHDRDYHAEALESAVAEHRYEVQATLYLTALHRLLKSRLRGDYDPLRHLGGAICLFLRGIRGPESGCYLMPPPLATLEMLDREMAVAGEGIE